jgi:multidrug efflux system membrane fusion protein
VFLDACSPKKELSNNKPVPVVVATAVKKPIPIQISTIGTVEAFQAISVRSQITGLITKVHFKEGHEVKKGDLLIELDCRSNEAALRQAEANLVKDRALVENAKEDLRRYTMLIEKNFVAKEEYDQRKTNLAALEATVKADEAAVQNNLVQVHYCSIYSPIDGRTGKLKVDQGNILKANDIEVVTINKIRPINVTFAIPEKELPRVKQYSYAKKLEVNAFLPGEEQLEKGELTFVDNAIDKATGTITLKGTFANKEKRLLPGQFVDVTLMLTIKPDAILVPSQGVEQGQAGQYVYVIGRDSTAEMRPVTIGPVINGETVILKGIHAGDQVVTDGQMRLTPGAKITIKNTK